MSFNISTFKSYMPDITSTANFYARITSPQCMLGTEYSMEKMSFLCHAGVIPGVRVTTDRVNRYGYSSTSYLSPYGTLIEDSFTYDFYIPNDDPLPIKAFNFWLQQVSGVANETLVTPSAGAGLIPGQVKYRDEYVAEMSLYSLDRSNQTIFETKLFGVYPVAVVQQDVNWATDDMMRLQVAMTCSGIQKITYTRDSDGVYKRDQSFGSPDYEASSYSEQLNKIRQQLDKLRPSGSLT